MRHFNLDKLGMILSAGCLVHCLLMPVVLPLLPLIGLAFGHNGYFHLIMCAIIFINICATLLPGAIKYHKSLPLMLGMYGLLAIIAGGLAELIGHVNEHREVWITMMGSCLIVVAHYLNHKYRCECAHHKESICH
jgi:hypothetical protein